MDLWQLYVFCKVVEHESFSRAGQIVHLSQPTVSSHIKDLEDHFGCRLIDRLSKMAVPTKAGELLYAYARRLIELRDEAETAIAEFHGIIKGRLTIGGSTIPGAYILPRVISAFTKQYPEVMVALKIGDTEAIIHEIITGQVEFGVVGARAGEKKLLQERLLDDDMCLAVSAEHPWAGRQKIPLAMLLSEPFIVREKGSGTLKSLQENLIRQGYSIDDLKIVAELGSTQAVIQGIRHNLGVSILSKIAVFESTRHDGLHALEIEGLNLKRSFYLTRQKDRSPSPIGRTFDEFLRKTV